MEINKQLLGDVLSGKLKGTFVRQDGTKLNSSSLRPIGKRLFAIGTDIYQDDGVICTNSYKSNLDIVDFIPDTNIKENELTIEIPEGKIIDWDESKKRNKIILKNKQLTYEGICKKLYENEDLFYICNDGTIHKANNLIKLGNIIFHENNATTKHQLECILAKNKLATVAKYLNEGWKPSSDIDIFLLIETQTGISVSEVANGSCASDCGSIWFKSKKTAQRAIEILGEETIKFALEPLGVF